jgi:hypothetical protein
MNVAGVSPSSVTAIVAAYTASANEMIADSGIDVSMLSEVLDDAALALARNAVVNGDTAKLKHIAQQGVQSLKRLSQNEAAFDAFMDANYFDVMYTRHENGKVTVNVEGMGDVEWETLVQLGHINSKTRVKARR